MFKVLVQRVPAWPTLISILAGTALLIASSAGRAQEFTKAPVRGGPDGRYFEFYCGPGRALVGLRGSAGVIVDSVQPVCARVDAGGGLSEPQPARRTFGGDRPFDKSADCPDQMVVGGISAEQGEKFPVIGSIRMQCSEIAHLQDGGSSAVELSGSGHLRSYVSPTIGIGDSPDHTPTDSLCSAPSVAVGIYGRASQYVNAIGLLCGTPVTAKVDTAFTNLIGQEASFQASNYLDRFIRHRQSLGYAEPVSGELGLADSTFRIDPGLAGKCISLESHNYPGQFLRHQAWRIKLAANDNSDLFKQDATFCMVPGLASSTGVSFESVNNPHHFIRHRNGELWVDDFDGTDLFRADATFNVTNPGGSLVVR